MRDCEVEIELMDQQNQDTGHESMALSFGPVFRGDCFAGEESPTQVPLWDGVVYVEKGRNMERVVVSGRDGPSGGLGIDGEFKIPCEHVNLSQRGEGELTCDNLPSTTSY